MESNDVRITKRLSKGYERSDYNELVDMIESGMEDYEIASELGLNQGFISRVKRELYND